MSDKMRQRWTDTCDLCGQRHKVEQLVRVYWVCAHERELPGGLVCSGCWNDLGDIEEVSATTRTWKLMARAY